MAQLSEYRDFCGKVMLRVIGVCALLLFLLWNPLALRPRLWNTSVVARSMAIDAALLVAGIGFIWLRKWAGLLSSAFAGYVAFASLLSSTAGMRVFSILIALMPLVLTLVFWRTLVLGNKRSDPLLALAIVVVDALVTYTAYVWR